MLAFPDPKPQFTPVRGEDFAASTLEGWGAVFGQTLAQGPARAVGDVIYRNKIRAGGVGGRMIPRLQAQERLAKAGKQDALKNMPGQFVSAEAVAYYENIGYEDRRRAAIIERANVGPVAQFGVSMLAAAVDPLNLGVSLMPIGAVAGAGLMSRSALTRFGAGAAIAGAENLPLSLIEYAGAQATLRDYSMTDVLANVAFGGILGGGIAAGAGALRLRYEEKLKTLQKQGASDPQYRAARSALREGEPVGTNAELLHTFRAEEREAIFRMARVQAMDGPVDVEPTVAYLQEKNGLQAFREARQEYVSTMVADLQQEISRRQKPVEIAKADLEKIKQARPRLAEAEKERLMAQEKLPARKAKQEAQKTVDAMVVEKEAAVKQARTVLRGDKAYAARSAALRRYKRGELVEGDLREIIAQAQSRPAQQPARQQGTGPTGPVALERQFTRRPLAVAVEQQTRSAIKNRSRPLLHSQADEVPMEVIAREAQERAAAETIEDLQSDIDMLKSQVENEVDLPEAEQIELEGALVMRENLETVQRAIQCMVTA